LLAFAVTSFVLIAVPGAECAVHDQPGATMGRRGASAHGWNARAAFTVIKLVGAAYLIYLGVQGIRPAAAPGDHL
jgi:threonine/homoserine/homoserine lactone efflux protein